MTQPSAIHDVVILYTVFSLTGGNGRCASAQCLYVILSGSEYSYSAETTLDGQYELNEDALCNALPIWIQQQESSPNFIFYNTYNVINSTQSVGWAVGPTMCITRGVVYALNTAGNYNDPYSVPTQDWLQLNPSTGSFIKNPNISIQCTSDSGTSDSGLTSGEIIAIVFGSVIGAILLCYILSYLCQKCNSVDLRRINVDNIDVELTSASTTNSNLSLVNHPGSTSTSNVPSTSGGVSNLNNVLAPSGLIVEPPAYDSHPPPSYEDSVK